VRRGRYVSGSRMAAQNVTVSAERRVRRAAELARPMLRRTDEFSRVEGTLDIVGYRHRFLRVDPTYNRQRLTVIFGPFTVLSDVSPTFHERLIGP
jgi:hypothetical protein